MVSLSLYRANKILAIVHEDSRCADSSQQLARLRQKRLGALESFNLPSIRVDQERQAD